MSPTGPLSMEEEECLRGRETPMSVLGTEGRCLGAVGPWCWDLEVLQGAP